MRRIVTPMLVGALALAATVVTTSPTTAVEPTAWDGLVLGDGFEYGLGDWGTTHSGAAAVPNWRRAGLGQRSGIFAAHLEGAGSAAEQFLTTAALPLGDAPQLSFWHRWDFEWSQGTNWDGGVIEYTVDGGTTWLDLNALAPAGYTGTITAVSGNPLGGRQGYTHTQATYKLVSLSLPALANQTVQFRFRFGADEAAASDGWWIDDVEITNSAPGAVQLPAAPTGVQATASSPTRVAVTFTPAGGSPSRPVVAHLATCTAIGGATGTAYTRQTEVEVAGLTTGKAYSCTVRAWTTAGLGAASSPDSATPAAAPKPAASGPSTSRVGHRTDLTNFDALAASTAHRQLTAAQRSALNAASKPGTTPGTQDQLGVPTTLWAADPGTVARPGRSGERPEVAAARGHLARLAAIYRLSPQDVAATRAAGVHNLGRGAVVVELDQAVRGIPVWHERLNVVMTRDLGLVGLTGYLLPRHVSHGVFDVSSREALAAAFGDLTGHRPTGLVPAGRRAGYDRFTGNELLAPARAKEVLYRLPGGLISAYYVELRTTVEGETREFGYVVSAADGRVLNRTDLVSDADYRVWADASAGNQPYDGPQGSVGSPHPTGLLDGYQAPFIPSSLVSGPLSGDPWLPLGATESTGNNVDAYTDIAAPDGFSNGTADTRANTSSPGVFDYTYDHALSPTANATQAKAALTQLFYDINYFHDWFYESGFDEAAGNAQQDNYLRGGAGGDPIHAEDQDNAATERDNANMSTPADGASPRMQMYVWTGPTEAGLDVNPGGLLQVGLAAFGPSSFDLTDDLVVAVDGTGASTTDACEALTNGATVSGKIAVVDRGTCTFQDKATNAQNAGAVAMVVVNDRAGLPPSMGAGCTGGPCLPPTTIGSLSITQADGAALKTAIAQGTVTGRAFRIPQPLRDGALDSTIVAHEWGHYLAHRLAPSLGNQQAQAMGEGWSDFVALLLMVQPEDVGNLDGAFAVSAYAAASVGSPNQYYFGLRRTPYSTDFTKNALTFRHITDGEPLPAVPLNILSAQNSEVHNAGEIWANMLWECYSSLLADTTGPTPRLSFAEARQRMTDYLVASLKATPANPTYLEARDALLLTAWANDPADFDLFLAAFARRGAGTGAVAPPRDSPTFAGVEESYSTDDGPPTTSITLSGGTAGNSGWYVEAPIASVTAVDGIKVSAIRCVLDDPTHQAFANLQDDAREPCDYSAPGAHLPEGVHLLHAASTDVTEQSGDVATATVKVDSTPPTLVCLPANLWTGQPGAQVRATVIDTGSGPAVSPAGSSVDTSTPGAGSVPVTGQDVAGNETTVDCPYTVTTDVTAPTVVLNALPVFTTGTGIALHYAGTDTLSGVAAYTIQVRKASYTATGLPTAWSPLSTLPGTTFTAKSLAKGTTYCFRVIAQDKAGNSSAPSAQRCTARLVDDPALKHSAGWSKVSSAAYYGGTASRTKRLAATLSLGSVHSVRLALRATTCPTCGSVKVLVGSTLVKTVSLVSATTKQAVLITIPLPRKMVGTVKITTRSTKAVTIDGLGLSHA